MQESEYWHERLSREEHHLDYTHQSKMNKLVEQEEYNLFFLLKPKVYIDGDQWCVLLGENLQEGICGFGDTVYKAILAFNKAFHEPIKTTHT